VTGNHTSLLGFTHLTDFTPLYIIFRPAGRKMIYERNVDMTADLAISIQRSLLSADALAERLLPEYDLPAGTICHFWHQSINDTYLVRAGATRLMLRVAPAYHRSREQVLAELDLLRYLGQRGILYVGRSGGGRADSNESQ
jgi:hypothetical protein